MNKEFKLKQILGNQTNIFYIQQLLEIMTQVLELHPSDAEHLLHKIKNKNEDETNQFIAHIDEVCDKNFAVMVKDAIFPWVHFVYDKTFQDIREEYLHNIICSIVKGTKGKLVYAFQLESILMVAFNVPVEQSSNLVKLYHLETKQTKEHIISLAKTFIKNQEMIRHFEELILKANHLLMAPASEPAMKFNYNSNYVSSLPITINDDQIQNILMANLSFKNISNGSQFKLFMLPYLIFLNENKRIIQTYHPSIVWNLIDTLNEHNLQQRCMADLLCYKESNPFEGVVLNFPMLVIHDENNTIQEQRIPNFGVLFGKTFTQ